MKRFGRFLVGSSLLPLFAACGGAEGMSDWPGSETTSSTAQSLSGIPLPISKLDEKSSGWDGSLVDLMVLDTWATCGFVVNRSEQINHRLVDPGDVYLDKLLVRGVQ